MAALACCSLLYTRLDPVTVATSGERRAVFAAVAKNPGLHLRALQRVTGFAWGKLSYHVGVLTRMHQIRLERRSKYVHVFPANGPAAPALSFHHRGAAGPIFDAIPAGGGVTQRQLEEALGLSHQLVSYHLRTLVAGGWILVVDGRPRRYVRAALPGSAVAAPA